MTAAGSPWLAELERNRDVQPLDEDTDADAVVIGGGISGIAAAYRLLRSTDLEVMLLEAGLVAHGATGHNGGQVVAAFERPFASLADDLGPERAEAGYRELNAAWDSLRGMLAYIGRPELLEETTGEMGISRSDEVRGWAEELRARKRLGLPAGPLRVAGDARVSGPLGGDVELAYRDEIEDLLWSRDHRYLAAAETKVGTINSALFTELTAARLLEAYPERFRLGERSPVDLVRLGEDGGTVRCNGHTVFADTVVLCTNGYQAPRFEACSPPAVHRRVQGVVGYMVGSLSDRGVPGARVYMREGEGETYYYLTVRRYGQRWLTATGGPEHPLPDGRYDPERDYYPGAYDRIASFLASTLAGWSGTVDMRWHGLMGYTGTRVRTAGQDPHNPALFYNLGCNGIGILSAVAGATRTAEVMAGEDLPPSMFDPELLAGPSGEKKSVQRVR